MSTQSADQAVPHYLAIFGRGEILHFRSEESLLSYMRDEVSSQGTDLDETMSDYDLKDAFVTHIHDRDEGPVQWDSIAFEPSPGDEEGSAGAIRTMSSGPSPDVVSKERET